MDKVVAEALIRVKLMNSCLQLNCGKIMKCPICGNDMESGFAMLSSGSYLRWYREAKDLHEHIQRGGEVMLYGGFGPKAHVS